MPVFGDYSTLGEPVAVVNEYGHTSTIWQARLSDASDGRLYAIKVYSPRKHGERETENEAALGHDRRLEFIEGVKELKKAQSKSGYCLAPVHAFAIAPEGAWYVTDFYPRSLKTLINLKVRADDGALRHLVYDVVTACLAMKQSRGFSHGNLKTSNIFLVGKPRALRKTPLQISDPYPASSYQLAQLDATDHKAISELLTQTMEAHDLRAIGELILQLVEGHLISGSYAYDYPVAKSSAWDQLGREGERWRAFCNTLLDPQLSSEKVSLEKLEKQFRPSAAAGKLVTVVGGAVVICLIGGGVFYGVSFNNKRKAGDFQNAMRAANNALDRTNLAVAQQQIEQALERKPADAQALKLKDQILQTLNSRYASAMESARTQLRATNLTGALEFANQALEYKPVDADARDVVTAVENERKFQATMTDAQAAFKMTNYDRAVELAEQAVGIKSYDATAITLRDQARSNAANIQLLTKRKEDYQNEMSKARDASASGDYSNALAHAEVALGIIPNDQDALALKTESQNGLGEADTRRLQREKFQQTMAAAQKTFQQANYTNAITLADQALGIMPKDPNATKLRNDAENQLKLIYDAEDQKRKYQEAITQARAAMQRTNYTDVITLCDQALGIRRGDDEATKLRQEAQTYREAMKTAQEIDQKYQEAMKQSRASVERMDYSNALSFVRQALLSRPNDASAMKLQADAQTKLDAMLADAQAKQDAQKHEQELDKKYQTAMRDGQAAFDQGRYNVAEKQANAALALENRNNDAKAMSLKQQAADIQSAQNSFAKGDYETASAKCAKYHGIDAFDTLGQKVSVPKEALDDANRRFNAGDYSFIEKVETNDYATNAAFASLLTSARSESQTLHRLQTLMTNVESWAKVKEGWDKLTSEVKAKQRFQGIKEWVKQNNPIEVLDGQLQLLRVWLGTRSSDGNIIDPNTHLPATKLASGTDIDPLRNFEAQLKTKFSQLDQLTPNRKTYFAELEKAMDLWYK